MVGAEAERDEMRALSSGELQSVGGAAENNFSRVAHIAGLASAAELGVAGTIILRPLFDRVLAAGARLAAGLVTGSLVALAGAPFGSDD